MPGAGLTSRENRGSDHMSDQQSSGFQVGVGVPDQYELYVAPLMKPFVAALVDAVVRPGQRVLDVACGTGFATRVAAHVIGSGGHLAAIDINPAMISKARQQPIPGDVDWRVASALELPFEDESFDAIICQQGLQFLPSPADGLAEMRRVLRPGGTLGATVWAPLHLSPYLAAQAELMVEYAGVDKRVLAQAFPPEGKTAVEQWLASSTWGTTQIETLVLDVSFPALRHHIPNHLRALPWSGGFFTQPVETQAAAVDAMVSGLEQFIELDGTAHIPTASLLLTATRS